MPETSNSLTKTVLERSEPVNVLQESSMSHKISFSIINTLNSETTGELRAITIHGGAPAGNVGHIAGLEEAELAINAIQDVYLGLFGFVAPGLHLRVGAAGRIVNNAGYVSSEYRGGLLAEKPQAGWWPVNIYNGKLVLGAWKNKDQEKAVQIRHTVMEAMALGEPMTIHVGPATRARWNKAVAKIKAGAVDGVAMRNLDIHSKIHSDAIWQEAKGTKVAFTDDIPVVTNAAGEQQGIVVKNAAGEELDLTTIKANKMFSLKDARGKDIKPRWWMPKQASSVQWWAAFAASGGTVQF
jgi:hypothetical protein